MTNERNHAKENAEAWMESIREMVAECEKYRNDGSWEGENALGNADERIQESPLSVEVRSGWYAPSAKYGGLDDNAAAAEFKILLSTGGPALRIVGDLTEHCGPETARLEYQDWGTPWTPLSLSAEDEATLLSFCSHFYYGE